MSLMGSKLPPRYAVSDWKTSNKLVSSNAERLRNSSHTVRQDARSLRNQTENHTRWTQHDTNTKLEKRIDDINEWKEALERCLNDTDKEIESLQVEKEKTERALEAKQLPLDVAIECLMLRENRIGIDLVRDGVEEQLHKEVEVIEGIKALLQQKVSEAFEQLCLLQEAFQQMYCDVIDKKAALEIDNTCAELNNGSDDIGFQINPTRIIKGSVTPETWDAHSKYNKLRAEAEMNASERLREAIFATLEKTKNDLEAQRRATEFSFRKRIQDTKQAQNELQWQQRNTKEEIATLEQDIQGLREAIDAKMAPMKVAQTRLDNRTHRPNVELCRDIPQYQLCYEVGEIDGSIRALIKQLETAESALESLLKDLARIEEDLAIKTNSLALDGKCMETRMKLTNPDYMNDNSGVDAVADGLTRLSTGGSGQRTSPVADIIDYEGAVPKYADHETAARSPSIPEYNRTNDITNANATSRQSQRYKDALETTYGASYEIGKNDIRSGDLARTLGKATTMNSRIGQRHTVNKNREILVD
eukprot:gene4861-5500_t